MKRNIMLFALAMGVIMTSCGKIDQEQACEKEKEVVVNFSIGCATKATDGIDDDNIKTAYVFVFDGDRLDGSAFVTSNTGSISVTPGQRHFIAVVNPNSEFTFSDITTTASFWAVVSQLENEALDDMVMIGENHTNITSSTTSVPIPSTRLVSKISVKSLKFDLTGAMEGKTVSNVAMYIKNYPTTIGYNGTPGTDYTSGLYPLNQDKFEVYDFLGSVTSGSDVIQNHHFFCYERTTQSNTSGKNTIRLCIKGDIDGQTYYWSIPVNNGITWDSSAFVGVYDKHYGVKRNHAYSYDITITRPGIPDDGSQPDPNDPDDNDDDDLEDDKDITAQNLTFTLTIKDFVTVEEQTVSL